MPWNTRSVEQQREEIVCLAQVEGANISQLARHFGISRSCIHKWLGVARSGLPMEDRSRRPKTSPTRTSDEVEAQVLAVRKDHRWGGRKISRVLLDQGGPRVSPSTITEILRRHGCLDGPGAGEPSAWQRFEREQPNELWQMDFKGHFPMLCGDRCHPFDCIDDHSRFCVSLEACSDEKTQTVKEHLTGAFRSYGLPMAILCDNGGCWGGAGIRDMNPLSLWMSQLGIQVLHGRPYHPETQGKEERFHKSLNYEILEGKIFRDLAHCQEAFKRFRSDYNLIRPHESLDLNTPASAYRCSPAFFPEGLLKEPEYPSEFTVRKVQAGGVMHLWGRELRVGKCLRGRYVGVRSYKQEGLHEVCYGKTRISIIDLREKAEQQEN